MRKTLHPVARCVMMYTHRATVFIHIMNDRLGYLVLNTYAGRREYPVLIIGETPKKFRVKILSQTNVILPGRRIANYGDIILVPKTAVYRTN